jgi:hypothetical protein
MRRKSMARTTTKDRRRTSRGESAEPPEIIAVDEVKNYYPDELIIMQIETYTDEHKAKTGRILYHGTSADEAFEVLDKHVAKRSGQRYYFFKAHTFPSFTNLREAVEYVMKHEDVFGEQ